MWGPRSVQGKAECELSASEKAAEAAKDVVAQYQRLRDSDSHHLLHPEPDQHSIKVDNALAQGSPSEVVAYGEVPNTSEEETWSTKYETVSREDMRTLSPREWLNDVVINFYFMVCLPLLAIRLRILHPGLRKSHFFNSFFLMKMFDEYNDKDPSSRGRYNYDNIKRWSKKFDPFEQEYIFCPYNYDNMHWGLAIIHVQAKTIAWYDSLGYRKEGRMEGLLSYMMDEWNSRGHCNTRGPFNEDEWSFTYEQVPRQSNGKWDWVRHTSVAPTNPIASCYFVKDMTAVFSYACLPTSYCTVSLWFSTRLSSLHAAGRLPSQFC